MPTTADSRAGFPGQLGQRLLDLERMPSLAEVFDHIQRITAPDLQDLANEVFDADRFSQLDYLPEA